jgi:hypothetical protein
MSRTDMEPAAPASIKRDRDHGRYKPGEYTQHKKETYKPAVKVPMELESTGF